MQFSREHYRVGSSIQGTAHRAICTLSLQSMLICWYLLQDTRLEDYRNYLNLKDEVDAHQEELVQECLSVQKVQFNSRNALKSCYNASAYSSCMHSGWVTALPHCLLEADCMCVFQGGKFFDFYRNSRSVKSSIVHFQVRPSGLVGWLTKHAALLSFPS